MNLGRTLAIASITALVAMEGVAIGGGAVITAPVPPVVHNSTLTGTGKTASPLGVDTTAIQVRVSAACSSGTAIRAIGADGSLTCETTGDITSVGATAGGGLTGGSTAGPALLSLITTCSDGQVLKSTSGSWSCANDTGGITNSAGTNVLMKSNGTNAVASSWTDDGTTSTTTGAVKINGLATTVKDFEVSKTAATAWHLTTRDTPTTYPASVMRASQTDTVLAFDLMPNGAPTIGSGGYTWFDACDADLWANNAVATHCARVGIDGAASFGSMAFNGATARDLRLHINGTDKVLVQSTGSTFYGTISALPTSGNGIITGVLNQNSGTWGSITNTSSGTGAYSKYEVSNDASTGVLDIFAFGTGYTTNGGLMQDSGVLYSGAGMSNGLNLIAGGASAPMRFYTGGLASGNLRMTIGSAGDVSIGSTLGVTGAATFSSSVAVDSVSVTTGTGATALFSTKRATSTDGLNVCIGGGCQLVAYDGSHAYSGSTNSAFGIGALAALTTGYENTAIGRYALTANTTGFSNTAIGMTAGLAMTTGGYNTCVGAQSCLALTTANDNTVVGQLAYAAQTTGGNGNTIMGVQAMQNSNGVNAKQNVAIGLNAYLNGTAQNNVIIGYVADTLATTANSSVIIGMNAALAHTTGNQNTLIGEQVAQDLTTGGTNTFLGRRTGYGITTGSNNTILGANVTGLSSSLSNNVILADGAGTVRFQVDSSGNTSIGATGATLTVTGNTNTSAGVTTLGQYKGTVQSSTATATQNDFVINATTTFLRWSGVASNVVFTGFKCGASDCGASDDGRVLVVVCNGTTGGNSCTLARDSASSTAANRIYTLDGSHNVALLSTNATTTASAMLIYDGTALRWRVVQMWSTRHDENFEFVNTVTADSGMSVGAPGLTTIGNGNIMIASGGIGHMLNKQTSLTPGSCGTSPSFKATDVGGRVTTGTGATGCVITFGTGYTTDIPACVVTFESGATGSYTTTTTALTITAGAGVTFDYWCSGFTG